MRLLLALLLPSTLLTLCCVLGCGLAFAGRKRRWVVRTGSLLLAFSAIGFAAVLILPVDLWLLWPLEDRFPAPAAPAHVDGVVVLGGAMSERVTSDRGTPVLNREADRLVAFAALARRYPEARLVFAGGQPPNEEADRPTEAEASRSLLEQLGVAPGRVRYDDQSRTTWENAVDALPLAHPKPGETWLLVTSASHMPRAVGAFRAAGWPDPVPWPVAYRTTTRRWPLPLQPVGEKLAAIDLAAHEWGGLVVYWLEGRSIGILPE